MCASATTMNKRKQDDHDDGCDHHPGDHDDDCDYVNGFDYRSGLVVVV